MTISSGSSSIGYDIKYTTDNVVATHKIEYGEKVYTVKVYYESEWEPSDGSEEMVSTIGCVKRALDVFKEQLGEGSLITLTHENKLFVGRVNEEESESYTFSFKDCLPADHIDVYVGEIEESDDVPEDFDLEESVELAYSEKDVLLLEENLKEERGSGEEPFTPHVPVKNSALSKPAQKNLQGKPHCFSHMLSPRDDRECGLSAFFCVLATAFAQKVIDSECVARVEDTTELWLEPSGIAKNNLLSEAFQQGFECIEKLCKNPKQADLREIIKDPKAKAAVNFTLRQIALVGIFLQPGLVENLMPEGADEKSIAKFRKQLFEKTKFPGKEVDFQVIAILGHLFQLDLKLLHSDASQEGTNVIEQQFSFPAKGQNIEGVAIFEENDQYHVLLNQRVFHFI